MLKTQAMEKLYLPAKIEKRISHFTGRFFAFLSFKKFLLFTLLIFSLGSSCRKKDKEGEIPYVEVNFDVSLSDPSFVDLNAVGGWVYVSGGVLGIIIYRKSQNEFMAYERNCPYKPDDSCSRIAVDASNVKAKDDCCGSVFSLIDGTVLNGPSTRPMKQYATSLISTTVHVQN